VSRNHDHAAIKKTFIPSQISKYQRYNKVKRHTYDLDNMSVITYI